MTDRAELWSAGWAALQAGRPAEAERLCRPALHSVPGSAEGWFLLGAACHDQGRPAEAADCYARSLALRPDLAGVHFNLGLARRDLGQFGDAEVCFRQSLALRPDRPEVHYHLGNALWNQARRSEAEDCFRQALALRPDYPEALINLGNALQDRDRLNEAEGCFRQALTLRPDYLAAMVNLGTVLQSQGRPGGAEQCFRRSLELRPDLTGAYYNLGLSLRNQGQPEEAEAYLRRALAMCPDSVEAHDALLLTLHYRAGVTPTELAAAHAEYQNRHAAPLRAAWRPFANDRDPERPLRLGFVSSDLGRHPVGFLLVQATEALARRPGALLFYSNRLTPPDDLTARLRAAAGVWRDTAGLNDEQLAELVRADGVDVLIDLAGHTGGNRLLAFARRPAPVQMTWLGYEGTTGLEAIDYLIADERLIPPGAEAHHRERVLRLPGGYACYDPPADAPEPGPPPALAKGQVTFGCFNNPAKLSAPALAAFAAVLSRVPGSRLLLQYRGLGDPATAGRLRGRLTAAGADLDRVELRGAAAYAGYLAAYNDVDVALDPFPFGGGVTTCDALWMGVPVVTLPQDTFASRHGLSYLASAGLADALAARHVEDYMARAAGLAQDLDRLADLHAGLRADGVLATLRWRAACRRIVGGAARRLAGVGFGGWTMKGESEAWSAGWAALRAGRAAEAERLGQEAVQGNPGGADGWFLLGTSRHCQGRPAEAAELYARALGLRPDFPEVLLNLGAALQDLGRPGEAEGYYRQALCLRPDYPEGHNNLGNTLRSLGRPGEAEGFYRQALRLRPDYPEAHNNLGNTLQDLGRLGEATECYRRALTLRSDFVLAHDNLLQSLHYQAEETPEDLAVAHAEFQERHAAPFRAAWRPHSNNRDPERPLRLGFVSPDLGRHPVGFLLVQAAEALARRPGALFYSNRLTPPDDLTARLRAAATVWRDTVGLSDEQFAEQVRADGVDVLIDLAGHTGGNRLLAFARRPAPVQATWLGYEGTTGLEAIDYLIADDRLIPPGAEAHHRERVLRLPGGYAAYDPPVDAPEPGPPPALAAGRVTFGCFNNPAKLSAPALAAFAAVLSRVPGSRLLLQYRGLDDSVAVGRLRERLAAAGTDLARTEVRSQFRIGRHNEYLAAYREVDVALDPFPFGGGVTTCDALWMGVPVVTLPGRTFASRHGLGSLSSVGLADQLAARDVDEYVVRSAELAQDLGRLSDLRAGLRGRVACSPLCDGGRLADELLAALRGAWREWTLGGGR